MYPHCPCVSGDMCQINNMCVLIHGLYSLFPHAFVRFELCSRSLSCTRTYTCKYISILICLKHFQVYVHIFKSVYICTNFQVCIHMCIFSHLFLVLTWKCVKSILLIQLHKCATAHSQRVCWPCTMNYTAVDCDHGVLISIHTHTLSSAHVSAVHCARSQCLFPPFPRLRG